MSWIEGQETKLSFSAVLCVLLNGLTDDSFYTRYFHNGQDTFNGVPTGLGARACSLQSSEHPLVSSIGQIGVPVEIICNVTKFVDVMPQ